MPERRQAIRVQLSLIRRINLIPAATFFGVRQISELKLIISRSVGVDWFLIF